MTSIWTPEKLPAAPPRERGAAGPTAFGGGEVPWWHSPLALTSLAVAAGVATALVVFAINNLDGAMLLMAVTGAVGVAAGLAALMRFEWFLIGLFVTRATLDAFSGESAANLGGMNPATTLGMVFVVIGTLWLFVQWRVGVLVRWSTATVGAFFLVVAAFASLVGTMYRGHALEAAISLLSCAVMFASVEQLSMRQRAFSRLLLGAIFASLVVPVAVGFSQLRTGETEHAKDEIARVSGTFAHPNPFATYLMIVLLLGLAVLLGSRRWGRLVGGVIVASAGPLLLFTYARAAWGATLIAVAYVGWRHSRRLLGLLGLGIVVLVLSAPSVLTRLSDLGGEERYEGVPANSLVWRIGYWQDLVGLAGESPVFGVGLDTVQFRTDDALRPHNVFVQTYVETGLIGVLALGIFIVGLAATLRDRRRRSTTRLESTLASAAVGVGIGLFLQAFTENLGTSTVVWWYAAGAFVVARGWSHEPDVSNPVVAMGSAAAAREGRGRTVLGESPAQTGPTETTIDRRRVNDVGRTSRGQRLGR